MVITIIYTYRFVAFLIASNFALTAGQMQMLPEPGTSMHRLFEQVRICSLVRMFSFVCVCVYVCE